MTVGSKAKRTFLSGMALCIISGLLVFLGTVGLLSQNAEFDTTYFFVPLFFLITGIIAIAMSREKNSKSL
jgi:hypothetical protein